MIADAGGAAPATLAALGRLRTKLAAAELVVTLGGMGADQAQLEATIGALAPPDSKAPIVVVPGDLEPIDALEKAVAALAARKVPALDGRRVERIALTDATTRARRRRPRSRAPRRRRRLRRARDRSRLDRADARRLEHAPDPRRLGSAAHDRRRVRVPHATGDLPPDAIAGADLVLAGAIDTASAMRSGARDGNAIALAPGLRRRDARRPPDRRPPRDRRRSRVDLAPGHRRALIPRSAL